MATTIGQEAADFIRICGSIHFLISQRTLQPDDRAVIELSLADLMAKLKSDTSLFPAS